MKWRKFYSEGMESGEKRGIEMGELKPKKKPSFRWLKMGNPS